jgi:hypothetical protein
MGNSRVVTSEGQAMDRERFNSQRIESNRLETRLGALAWRSSGEGPTLVCFAGALANGELWRDVVGALEDRYRCITIDLPLGAHPWPLSPGADRSATSLARLLLDCLEPLDVEDATVIANDTAGGLLLLSLATGHPALARVSRLVLTNCDSYDQFPPEKLQKAAAMCRTLPRLARALLRLQLRSSTARRRVVSSVAASGLDHDREESFFGPVRRDERIAEDLVAAQAGFRPQLLIDAAEAIPWFDRPVLPIWGESCDSPNYTGAATRVRVPPRHPEPRSRSQDVGPDRRSGRGGRRRRDLRADASDVTAPDGSPDAAAIDDGDDRVTLETGGITAASAGTWTLCGLTVNRIGFGAMRACGEQGIAFVPFFAIAGEGREAGATPDDRDEIVAVARAHDATPAQVRLAWTLHKAAAVHISSRDHDPSRKRSTASSDGGWSRLVRGHGI